MRIYRKINFSTLNDHVTKYPTPLNLSYNWSFGSLAFVFLFVQIFTGIFLAMYYIPYSISAFDSVQHIMREVNYGYFFRYLHSTGSSFFFFLVYVHIARGLYFGSYVYPRGTLWVSGIIIFLLMMATAFLGYVLPWGQMSFWAATVITNLFSAFPIIGEPITLWLWGGFSVNNPTLKRFFVLHYLLPFIILAVVIIHFILLHNVGSSNPFGLNFFDVITFYPYYFLKDLVAVFFFFVLFLFFNGAYPHIFMHPDNDIIANSGVTPSHIVPEWYFLPFYAMLRAVPNKMGGVICMFLSIIILFFLPFLVHFTGVSVTTFRPVLKFFLLDFYFNFYFLGCLGAAPVEQPFVFLSRLLTFWYFFFLLFFLPFISFIEVCAITINDNIFKKNVELKRKLGSLTK